MMQIQIDKELPKSMKCDFIIIHTSLQTVTELISGYQRCLILPFLWFKTKQENMFQKSDTNARFQWMTTENDQCPDWAKTPFNLHTKKIRNSNFADYEMIFI